MRRVNRQSTRVLSSDEIKQIAESKKKLQVILFFMFDILIILILIHVYQILESEKKKKTAAEEKAQKLEAKENEKRKKENDKFKKEQEREMSKKSKELKKKEDKARSATRREVLNDMKRNRHDASLQVLQSYDDEQESFGTQFGEAQVLKIHHESTVDSTQNNETIESMLCTLETLQIKLFVFLHLVA